MLYRAVGIQTSMENIKFDATEALLRFEGLGHYEWFQPPEGADPEKWTRFALQVQPDGQVTVWVNGALAYRSRARLDLNVADRWRVRLLAASEMISGSNRRR